MRPRSVNVHKHFSLTQAIDSYALVLKREAKDVRTFLFDVTQLSGKIPDGTLPQALTREQDALLEGFSGKSLAAYTSALSLAVRTRLNTYQVVRGDRLLRRFRALAYEADAREEIKLCRDIAIASTLEQLIPGYTPHAKGLSHHSVMSTPMGGQPR